MSQECFAAVDRYVVDLLLPVDPALEASAAAGLPRHEVSPPQGRLLEQSAARRDASPRVTSDGEDDDRGSDEPEQDARGRASEERGATGGHPGAQEHVEGERLAGGHAAHASGCSSPRSMLICAGGGWRCGGYPGPSGCSCH
jgi:hypothetical protein